MTTRRVLAAAVVALLAAGLAATPAQAVEPDYREADAFVSHAVLACLRSGASPSWCAPHAVEFDPVIYCWQSLGLPWSLCIAPAIGGQQ